MGNTLDQPWKSTMVTQSLSKSQTKLDTMLPFTGIYNSLHSYFIYYKHITSNSSILIILDPITHGNRIKLIKHYNEYIENFIIKAHLYYPFFPY